MGDLLFAHPPLPPPLRYKLPSLLHDLFVLLRHILFFILPISLLCLPLRSSFPLVFDQRAEIRGAFGSARGFGQRVQQAVEGGGCRGREYGRLRHGFFAVVVVSMGDAGMMVVVRLLEGCSSGAEWRWLRSWRGRGRELELGLRKGGGGARHQCWS